METVITLATWLCLLLGCFLNISGAVGMLRFPDFYTRMHAAGVTDTLGAGFILLGLMLQAGLDITLIKLILILLFTLFTSPTATHALAKSALRSGLLPISPTTGSELDQ